MLARRLPLLLAVAVTAVSILLVWREANTVGLAGVEAAVANVEPHALVLALLFTAVSFLALGVYDVVAVRTVAPGRVSPWLAGATGAAAYAVSNALGFPLATGGLVRYCIYRSQGLDGADIGRVVGTAWLALWFGFAAVIGLAMAFAPPGSTTLPGLDNTTQRLAGLGLLAVVGGLVAAMALARREPRILGVPFPLPSASGSLVHLAAGIVDVAATLPPDAVTSLPVFAVVFSAATLAGILAHTPGGIGAFEATIIAGLGLAGRADAVAALVMYRVVYTALPFLIATAALAAIEVHRGRDALGERFATGFHIAGPLLAMSSASLVGGSAIALLCVALGWWPDHVAAEPGEAVRAAAGIAGIMLLSVARGLLHRQARARRASLLLLPTGLAAALSLGLGTGSIAAVAVLSLALYAGKPAFYRGNVRRSEHGPAGIRLSGVATAWLARLGFREVTAGPSATEEIPRAVETLVAQSPRASAALAFLGDKRFLVSPDGSAFLMYAVSGRSLVALGHPVGDPQRATELAWAFRELADRLDARPVFYQIGAETLPTYLDMRLSVLKIGEVARLDLSTFSMAGTAKQNLRNARRRLEKDGLVFSLVPAAEVPALLDEMQAVSDAWFAGKSGGEKGFSIGCFDRDYLSRFDAGVLRRDGELVAFANLWRGADKAEMTVDLMRYRPGVSRIIMDGLFVELILTAQAEGYRWFELGPAPLSGLVDHRLASWWNRIGSFIYRQGEEYYNFEGLRTFKQKFGPEWTPLYVACPGLLDTPKALVDLTALIAGGSPLRVFRNAAKR